MLTKYGTYTMREAMQRYLPMHYNGKTYMSISEPFCDHPRSLYPFYEGEVICIDERREDGFYAVYNATWDVLEEFVLAIWKNYKAEYMMICEDESAACDWEHPSDIVAGNDYYEPETGKICFL